MAPTRLPIVLTDDAETGGYAAPNKSQMEVKMPQALPVSPPKTLSTRCKARCKKAGVYHFNILFDKELLARVPLRVIAQSDLNPSAS